MFNAILKFLKIKYSQPFNEFVKLVGSSDYNDPDLKSKKEFYFQKEVLNEPSTHKKVSFKEAKDIIENFFVRKNPESYTNFGFSSANNFFEFMFIESIHVFHIRIYLDGKEYELDQVPNKENVINALELYWKLDLNE